MCGSDAGTTKIHKRLWQQEGSLFTATAANTIDSLMPLTFESNSCSFRQLSYDHKPDVVSGSVILGAGISQADNQFHELNKSGFGFIRRLFGSNKAGHCDDRKVDIMRHFDSGREFQVIDMNNRANLQGSNVDFD